MPSTLGHIYIRDLKPLERNAMSSLLKLSRGRGVNFEQIDNPIGAFAAIADGTAGDAVSWVLTLPEALQSAVIWLGACPEGWPQGANSVIARPISWPRLLQTLEALWRRFEPAQPTTPALSAGSSNGSQLPPTQHQAAARPLSKTFDIATQNVRSFASVVTGSTPGTLRTVPTMTRPRTIPQVPGSNVESVFSKLNILIVDDHAVARQSLQSTLGFFSIGAAEAASAQEAARVVRNDPFDLLFLDVNMPGIDGYALCRELKRGKLGIGDSLIVMVTSRDGLIDKLRGTLAGADYFLTKPASTLDIEPILKECLTRRSSRERSGAARR